MEWTNERIAHLAFLQSPKIGSNRLRALKKTFGSLHAAWQGKWHEWQKAGLSVEVCNALVQLRESFDTTTSIARLKQDQISLLLREDPLYPPLLHQLNDPPEALFARGTIRHLPWIAIVGSRRMTPYGARFLHDIIPDLLQAGCGVVSGLALGIDGRAHQEALTSQGYTLAFLGGGVDNASLYPRAHLHLAQEILASGGALLSEFAPGTESRAFHFPLRNRLIAGSSVATVVIEATLDSGSLITAKSALEENREVLAVPGPYWSPTSAGCHRLIQAGAQLCTGSDDILRLIRMDRPAVTEAARSQLPLDDFERRILERLFEPRSLDALAHDLQEPTHRLSSALSLLELKGLISFLEGQGWLRQRPKPSPIKQTSL